MRRVFSGALRPLAVMLLALSCPALIPFVARAQVVSGRVSNEAGTGIPHVRIVAFPVSDSSEAATRVAISNADGNFRLRLTAPARYVVRVRRIGFSPEPDQVFDAAQSGELKLAITLRALAIELPSVKVSASGSPPRCLALDDSLQNPQVREWVDHALDGMRMRRLIERDFAYQVNVSTTRSPGPGDAVSIVYAHDPDRRSNAWMEDDPANLAGVARALARHGVDVLPTEMSLITPIFRGEYCFFSAPAPADSARWSVRFRNRENQSGDLETSGTMTFTPDGIVIQRVDFEFKVGKTARASAQLGFGNVVIEGEQYPIITSRSMSRAATQRSPRAMRMDEAVAYTAFTRARGSSPLRPLRLPPGS